MDCKFNLGRLGECCKGDGLKDILLVGTVGTVGTVTGLSAEIFELNCMMGDGWIVRFLLLE